MTKSFGTRNYAKILVFIRDGFIGDGTGVPGENH